MIFPLNLSSWDCRTPLTAYFWDDCPIHRYPPDITMQLCATTGLIPISMATLTPNVPLGVDIYLRPNSKSKAVLFCAADDAPNLGRLAPLVSEGVSKLFIDAVDRDKYQQYLRDNWHELLADQTIPIIGRMAVMSEVIRDVLNEEFSGGNTDSIVSASQPMVSGTCELLADQEIVAQQLCSVLHHDYATFTHSTNVSMYCLLLARQLGFSADDVEEIAIGGLLHDLGKLEIDERILTKPGRLDEYEFRKIQKHPIAGFVQLVSRDDLSHGQLMMTYQHHERLDGSGYPVGCVAEEIHPWARLCAIVDVYEALTSDRPYRQPMSPKTAMAILEKGEGTEFDTEMLRCWSQLINMNC